MKNLKTKYMGIEIDNPIILGASNMASDLDKLKKAEELGAGAIVYKSLFEEQIQLERFQLDERLSEFNDLYAEMVTIHPNIEHAGPDEHLMNIRKARESLSIPHPMDTSRQDYGHALKDMGCFRLLNGLF